MPPASKASIRKSLSFSALLMLGAIVCGIRVRRRWRWGGERVLLSIDSQASSRVVLYAVLDGGFRFDLGARVARQEVGSSSLSLIRGMLVRKDIILSIAGTDG